MSLAVSLTFKTLITVALLDYLTVQIGEPRLDIPGGNKHGDPLTRPAPLLATFGGGILELSCTFRNRSPIGVDHHNQCLINSVLPRSIVGKLLRESLPHELFP